MDGPPHLLRVIWLAAFVSSAAQAQTAAPAPPAAIEPPASEKLTKLFAGTPPKYSPPKAEAASAPAGDAAPRNRIVRLPTYIVRDKIPVPDEYEILTQKGRNAAIAQRYMGRPTDAERVLDSISLVRLWQAIPIIGRIPFIPFGSMSRDDRAALIYERIEKKRRYDELWDIEQFARDAEKAKAAAKPVQ